MAMKFKQTNRVPPNDGFAYRHAETGHVSSSMRYESWIAAINDHRAGNGLPPVTPEEAQRQNCENLSGFARREFCEDPEDSVQTIDLTLPDIVRGTLTLSAWKALGSHVVTQEEAERRAEICANFEGVGCKYNVAYRSGCGVDCQGLTDAVKSIVGEAATSQDVNLKACAVCKCSLSAKVHLPLADLQRFESAELQSLYPPHCWLAKPPEPV